MEIPERIFIVAATIGFTSIVLDTRGYIESRWAAPMLLSEPLLSA